MEKRSEGAWLIHHTKKLKGFENTQEFDEVEMAGKCGMFLSNLAASDEQSNLNEDKVRAIAKISGIKPLELDAVKQKLTESHLIDTGKNGSISILGITTSAVLDHTSDIFNSTKPSPFQKAALDLSENISNLPKEETTLREYIADTHKLGKNDLGDLFQQSEEFGFVDYEKLDSETKFYFNGNLFRKDVLKKTNAVLNSLKTDESRKILEVDNLLVESGCVSVDQVKAILGDSLLEKLQSIGMYDFNEVSNSTEAKVFITKPAAFSKYGNPFEEDALDLAKAFVSALYYGMNYSAYSRGKITMLKRLMTKLVDGYEVGPATAIGEDYNYLELKRVVQLRPSEYHGRYYMKLLKRDVGVLALQVLQFGDATEQTVTNLQSGRVTSFTGPESKRSATRKKQNQISKKTTAQALNTLRW